MDGTGDLFAPLLAILQPRWRCVVVSYPVDVPAGYNALLPLVASKLPSGPYVLIGESFSGPLAVMMAAQRPAGLLGVVLCASFLTPPGGALARMLAPFARLAMQFLPPPPRFAIAVGLLGAGATAESVNAVRGAIGRVDGAVLADRFTQVMGVDVTAEAARVVVPVLYLHAKRDRLVAADSLAVVCQSFSQLEAVQLDGPHLLLQRHPAEAADAIVAFCDGLCRGRIEMMAEG